MKPGRKIPKETVDKVIRLAIRAGYSPAETERLVGELLTYTRSKTQIVEEIAERACSRLFDMSLELEAAKRVIAERNTADEAAKAKADTPPAADEVPTTTATPPTVRAQPRKGIIARLLLMFRRSSKDDRKSERWMRERERRNAQRRRIFIRQNHGNGRFGRAVAVTISVKQWESLIRAARTNKTSLPNAVKYAVVQYIAATFAAGD